MVVSKMNDSAKILLKQQLEEQDERQRYYEERDNPEIPGWTLLLKDVVKAYGVCPFLNVWDDECNKRRAGWISNQCDNGNAYTAALELITDNAQETDLETEMATSRAELTTHTQHLVDSVTLPENIGFAELLENVYKRRDAKSQNKKSKECWAQTLRCLDILAQESRIDFAKFVHVQTGYHFRYRVPVTISGDGQPMDEIFTRLYDTFTQAQTQLQSLRSMREREVINARKQLASLILNSFQIEQTGRYYRRWTSLNDEKKEERIASYCHWYMRERGQSVVAAEAMLAYIQTKLASKDLKVSNTGLEWNGKQGLIINVAIAYDANTATFSLTHDTARTPKKKRPSKKKNEDIFQSDMGRLVQARANRLMLYEIVKTGSTHRDTVVDAVLGHLRCRFLPPVPLRGYLCSKYDEAISVIKANPIVT